MPELTLTIALLLFPTKQLTLLRTLAVADKIKIVFEIVEEAFAGPVTVREIVYVPGCEKPCIGFCAAEVLFIPDKGSPKFHENPVGHNIEVLVNCIVLLSIQVYVKFAWFAGASPIKISSKANPS